MIPRKVGPLVYALLLSGLMSLLVSGISTFRAVGWGPDCVALWTTAWLTAWLFAFPVIVIAAPIVRRCTERLLAPEAGAPGGSDRSREAP